MAHFGEGKEPTGTVRLWDVSRRAEVREFRGHRREVSSVVFSADGQRLLTASFDGTVRLWDVASGRELRRLTGHIGRVEGAVFAESERRVLSVGNERNPHLRLWDAETGRCLYCSEPVPGGFLGVAALGERRAVTAGRDGVLRWWRWKE